jgi:hypothetical protein
MLTQIGNTFLQIQGKAILNLPFGFYILKESPKEIYLEQTSLPQYKDILGDVKEYEELAYSHVQKTTNSLGFMFAGISGMGKTQIMNNLCLRFQQPVILITTAVDSNTILSIVEAIDSPVTLLFDEFEKVYSRKNQGDSEWLLSLFDGLGTKHRIISLVSMNKDNISEYFFGRPGRFIFIFKFDPLREDIAISFFDCPNEEIKHKMLNYFSKVNNLSYDIVFRLKELISIHGWDKIDLLTKNFNVLETNYMYFYILELNINNVKTIHEFKKDIFDGLYLHKAIDDTVVKVDIPEEVCEDAVLKKIDVSPYLSVGEGYLSIKKQKKNEYINKLAF